MRPHLLRMTSLASLLLAIGASAASAQDQARSERARDQTPIPLADQQRLTAADAEFACELYGQLRAEEGNLFLSPHSISQALSMAMAGARGETAEAMAGTLHAPWRTVRMHAVVGGLQRTLASREQGRRGADGFQLRVINEAWGQKDYTFLPGYLDVLGAHYGAGVRVVDFRADPEAARLRINDWVAEQTRDRIQDLLQASDVPSDTRLILTNAIYFKASWANQFQERSTRPAAFHRADGSSVQTPFMHQTEHMGYGEGDGFKVVELPYEGHQVSMLVIVPDDFAAFEAGLDADRLQEAISAARPTRVQLSLPRFETRSRLSLKDALRALGMGVAFEGGSADFSGMDGSRDLFVGDVIHQSFVLVDETGTEAAAATAVTMRATGLPAAPTPMAVDRPFLFVVRDRETGAVLFMGRILDPSAE
jgi:serine protease inhibitor